MYACVRASWTDRGAWSHCCTALRPASRRPLGSNSLPGKPSQWRTQLVRHNACLHLLIQSTLQHCWPEVICVLVGAKMMICEPARDIKYAYDRQWEIILDCDVNSHGDNCKITNRWVLFARLIWVSSYTDTGWAAKWKNWHKVWAHTIQGNEKILRFNEF